VCVDLLQQGRLQEDFNLHLELTRNQVGVFAEVLLKETHVLVRFGSKVCNL